MYTVKHVLCCHFSLSLSYFHSSSIHLSLPSHLLHHLCSCNKQSSSCALFHSLDFHSLLILAHPLSRHGSPAWLFDWLVCIPRWSYHAVKPTVYRKKKKPQLVLSHSTFCRHAAPVSTTLLSSPGESTLKAEMWWPYTLTTYKMHDHSQLHQNKSVSLSEWRACSPNRTIQVLNNSRLLIWASNHTDTSLSWVMEKWAWWKKILYAYGVWD